MLLTILAVMERYPSTCQLELGLIATSFGETERDGIPAARRAATFLFRLSNWPLSLMGLGLLLELRDGDLSLSLRSRRRRATRFIGLSWGCLGGAPSSSADDTDGDRIPAARRAATLLIRALNSPSDLIGLGLSLEALESDLSGASLRQLSPPGGQTGCIGVSSCCTGQAPTNTPGEPDCTLSCAARRIALDAPQFPRIDAVGIAFAVPQSSIKGLSGLSLTWLRTKTRCT